VAYVVTPSARSEAASEKVRSGLQGHDQPLAAAAVASSRAKRAFDLTIACLLTIFLSPLLVSLAALVVCTSSGPALFRQRRTGLNGRVFTIYKFRSMRVMEDDDAVTQARQNDERVTPAGRFLRRSSLDELPQLLNVIKGEMSMVGPRPHAVAHDAQFSELVPCYRERFRARPGLTGLAQIAGLRGSISGADGMKERVAQDITYIANWSIWLDVKIIFATVPLVLRSKNAF